MQRLASFGRFGSALLGFLTCAGLACQTTAPQPPSAAQRRLALDWEVVLPDALDPEQGTVRLWVPIPVSDGRQEVAVIDRPARALRSGPDAHGNHFFYVELVPEWWESEPEVAEDGNVQPGLSRLVLPPDRRFLFRYELARGVDHGGPELGDRRSNADTRRQLYVREGLDAPWAEDVGTRAVRASAGRHDPFGVARALYDFVLEDVDYGVHDRGWGTADVERVMDQHFGTSPDFAAYFVALARARSLPARFQAGYLVPGSRIEGYLSTPHAWAHFHVEGHGWFPVDLERADRNPSREEFYFGRLPANRVTVTVGTDLVLEPPQWGPELPWMAEAYAEQDGVPLEVRTRVFFREL